MSYDLYFASSNRHKFEEVKAILSGFKLKLGFFSMKMPEIQSESLEEIAKHKILEAFHSVSKPVIAEDAGLFIKSLSGFPGPYSSYVFSTIGNRGILELVGKSRAAYFQSVIAYCEQKSQVHIFSAKVSGRISEKQYGRKWGFDPIFIPDGYDMTYSQIKEKNEISHRFLSLRKFANWYLHTMKSND